MGGVGCLLLLGGVGVGVVGLGWVVVGRYFNDVLLLSVYIIFLLSMCECVCMSVSL